LVALTNKFRDFVQAHQIAGAVGLVSRSGRIAYLEAIGEQDLEAGVPMRTNTIFDMRSMTKAVTAIAVMCLVEDGKLRLQDQVSSCLHEFANIQVADHGKGPLRPPSRPINLLDLLTHTSGLPTGRPPKIENITRVLDRSLDEAVRIIATQPLQADPGGAWNYSSIGFAVLGRIVEVRGGKSYQDFVNERILGPLGMNDSFFFPPRQKWPRIAAMYKIESGVLHCDSIDIYRRGAKYSAPILACTQQRATWNDYCG
jgi:CubicO group peptidase (beta-lactamase class C family)